MEFQKMRPEMLSDRAKALNRRSVGVNVHDHMMFEFAIHKAFGESNVFDTYYLPELRKGGFQVFITTVGANSPCMCNLTDHLEFGCFEQIDMLRQEEREGACFRICKTMGDIRSAIAAHKIALILAFEGARALEGRHWEESMVMLRTFYELGLRLNCIAGGARTAFADGVGDIRADADLSDAQIDALGKNGGLIGLEIVKTELKKGAHESGEVVTFDRVVDHIDYFADRIGVEHLALGLDYDNFPLVHNVFRAMSPAPGSIEGFDTGIPKGDHMLNEPSNVGEGYVIAEYLCRRGYSDEQILGILGGNALRFMEQILGD